MNEKIDDYHGHPDYIKVWIALMLLFGVSLLAADLGSMELSLFFIFSTALIKAMYVLRKFMHLQWEPKFYLGIFLFSLLILAFFFFGIYPDITMVELEIAK